VRPPPSFDEIATARSSALAGPDGEEELSVLVESGDHLEQVGDGAGGFAAFRRAVPDLHAQVHDMLADGDKVVTRKTFHGTHTGEFIGLPATGNAISVDVIDIVRVRDGKFVEHWNVLDTLALMRQMGGVAPPAR
jgi:steroid delta-isomerase-like uncharacterized protein